MSGIQLPYAKCYDALHQVATERGFGENKIDVSLGSKTNENFLGDIYRVKMKETKGSKEISVILKVAPAEISRDEIPLHVVYQREILAYRDIFRVFRDLEEKNEVGAEHRVPFVECYYTSEEEGKEMIILEDLREKDFVRLPSDASIGLDHVTHMVTYLAKFHALSYVLKEKDPAEFTKLVNRVPDFTNQVKNFVSYCEKSLDIAADCIDNPAYSEKIKEAKKNFVDKLKMAAKTDEYSVICHSDCYLNNIMFKIQGGKTVEARLIDFQFTRYGSPAVDLVYMLLTSTHGHIRQNNYHHLISIYYTALSNTLQAYGISSEQVFPEDKLQEHVKENAIFGLVAGVALFRSMSVARYEAAQAGRPFSVDTVEPPRGTELATYKLKVTELVRDCIEYGYI